MKILLGIFIGAGIFVGASVYAASESALVLVEHSEKYNYMAIDKWYDQNNGVVCYTVIGGPS